MFKEKFNNYQKLKYEDSKFTIAGLFQFSDLILQIKKIVKNKLEVDLPIISLYGSPEVLWNGGRITFSNKKIDFFAIKNEIKNLKKQKIKAIFTFTNHLLKIEDLTDEDSNKLLQIAEETSSSIIVASDILYNYIKKNYPNIELHSSAIKACCEKTNNIEEYYLKNLKRFKKIVLAPDDVFNEELLEVLPKKQIEILLNEKCKYRCEIRASHYDSISREQRARISNEYEDENFLDRCNYLPLKKQKNIKERNITLTIKEFENLYLKGFREFKIQGRTDNLYLYFFDLLRFTLDDEIAFPTIYSLVCEIIENYIKEKNNGEKN
ncbi:hypothetical protein [Cetobacterium sp.]|uniref:hypothetical protein n=1 Tax=Cetobacterium sp. TaxID=2071632 RepID=UPI003F2ED7BD